MSADQKGARLIEEQGVVVEVGAGKARVETRRSSSCGDCAAKGACSHLGGGQEARVWVADPLGVHPGDRVVIAVPEGTVLRAGFLVYLLPVAALLAGAVVGNHFAPAWGLSKDLGAAGLGIAAMAAALLATRFLGGTGADGPQIVRRL